MSLALFAACDKNNDDIGTINQEIMLNADTITLDADGNAVSSPGSITVKSSADWRLTGDFSWCTPSATKGGNGTAVTFKATANETGEDREVNLYFICGNATQKLTVNQLPEAVFEVDGKSLLLPSAGQRVTLKIKTNLDISRCETSEDWISYYRGGVANASGEQWVQFTINENTSFYDRNAAITLGKGTADERIVNVTQSKYLGVVIEGETNFEFGVNGGSTSVTVTGTVPFNPVLSSTLKDWISIDEISSSETDVITKTYKITCLAGNWTRRGDITFKATSGISKIINVSQVNPNVELFDIPDSYFSSSLTGLGYIEAKNSQYYLTYAGYTATSLNLSGYPTAFMKSVEGIERFTNLASLTLKNTSLKKVDLSKNTKISKLIVDSSPIEELVLGDNPNITSLSIALLAAYYNVDDISRSFTISGAYLKSLILDQNTWTKDYDGTEWIDITGCPALTSLSCNRPSGFLKNIYMTQAQKDAYDAGRLIITTHSGFDKNAGIVVK